MLERTRRAMKSGGTYVLIAFLIVIFAFFFGMPTQSCVSPQGPGAQQSNVHLADIAGESLSSNDLSILLNRFPDRNDRQNQNEDDESVDRRAKQALHTLVAIKVLSNLAGEHAIYAGSEEFRDFMRNPVRNFEYLRVYGSTGTWNGQLYQRYVQNQLGRRLTEYEQFKHQELKARKLLGNAVMQAGLLPEELDMRHRIANTDINLEYVAYDSDAVADAIDVDQSTIDQYLADQSDRVETYYNDNKDDEFTTPTRLNVKRIFIRKPGPNAGDTEKQKTNDKWNEAKRRVFDEDESIESVAADLSDGKSDLGFRPVGDLTRQVKNSLQDADIGTTEQVETQQAYIIAKLVDRKEKVVTSLEDAKPTIASQLAAKDQAKQRLTQAKQTLYERASSNPTRSLSATLDSLRSDNPDDPAWQALSVEETGDFTLESSGGGGLQAQLSAQLGGGQMGGPSWGEIPGLGTHEKLAATAFVRLNADNPLPDKQVYTIDNTDYLVRLKSKSEPEGEPEANFISSAHRERASEVVGGPQGMRAQMLPGFLKGWQSIFALPSSEFGTWIDRQIEEAVDNDVVTFNRRSRLASSVLNDIKPGAVETQQEKQKQKAKSKGGPSIKKLKSGSGDGDGPNIKLKQGSGSKNLKLNPKSGKSKSGESGSTESGSSSSGN